MYRFEGGPLEDARAGAKAKAKANWLATTTMRLRDIRPMMR